MPGDDEENDWIFHDAKEDDEGQEVAEENENVNLGGEQRRVPSEIAVTPESKQTCPIRPFEPRCQWRLVTSPIRGIIGQRVQCLIGGGKQEIFGGNCFVLGVTIFVRHHTVPAQELDILFHVAQWYVVKYPESLGVLFPTKFPLSNSLFLTTIYLLIWILFKLN